MITLVNADCLDFLQSIPDESIDLIIVDPPYFNVLNIDWDNQWPNETCYLDWCMNWTEECFRILKPDRCFYVWGTTKYTTFLRYVLRVSAYISEATYQNWIIWAYDWGGRTKKTFARKHEDLIMYSKGTKFLFNADDIRIPYKMAKNIRSTACNNPLGKIPTDVWEQNNHTGSKEYVNWHPTQKPLALLQRIIRANSNVGDTILDCFSGSGSTMIACALEDRKFTGCEMNKTYVDKSLERFKALKI